MFEAENGARIGAAIALAGVAILYAATRLALSAPTRVDGIGRALAQWLPVPMTAAAAVAMGRPIMAIGLIFGTSIACLSLILGLAGYISPLEELPHTRRIWPLVLPAALLVLLIGFRGYFTWVHAAMLITMGLTFLAVWVEPVASAGVPPFATPVEKKPGGWARPVLAAALALIGGWVAVGGAIITSDHFRPLPAPLMATAVLSPLVMLPVLGSATTAAQRGQVGQVVTALCGTVQLSLCALLPAMILIEALRGSVLTHLSTTTAVAAATRNASLTPFPLVTWRIDSVVLVVLAFALVPVAAGRWLPERFESMMLIAVYAAYLIAETSLSVRLIS